MDLNRLLVRGESGGKNFIFNIAITYRYDSLDPTTILKTMNNGTLYNLLLASDPVLFANAELIVSLKGIPPSVAPSVAEQQSPYVSKVEQEFFPVFSFAITVLVIAVAVIFESKNIRHQQEKEFNVQNITEGLSTQVNNFMGVQSKINGLQTIKVLSQDNTSSEESHDYMSVPQAQLKGRQHIAVDESEDITISEAMIRNLRHEEDLAHKDIHKQAQNVQMRLHNRATHGGDALDDSNHAKGIFAKFQHDAAVIEENLQERHDKQAQDIQNKIQARRMEHSGGRYPSWPPKHDGLSKETGVGIYNHEDALIPGTVMSETVANELQQYVNATDNLASKDEYIEVAWSGKKKTQLGVQIPSSSRLSVGPLPPSQMSRGMLQSSGQLNLVIPPIAMPKLNRQVPPLRLSSVKNNSL